MAYSSPVEAVELIAVDEKSVMMSRAAVIQIKDSNEPLYVLHQNWFLNGVDSNPPQTAKIQVENCISSWRRNATCVFPPVHIR